jgi:hypothetical protein
MSFFIFSALEFLWTIVGEVNQETLISQLSADKINKLEPAVEFFYEWYRQWELDSSSVIIHSMITDGVIEQCANLLLDVLKEIGLKITSTHFSGFSRDKNYQGAKDRLQDFVELLEEKILKVTPIEEEHKFKSDFIWVKVHDTYGNREFEMTQDVKFVEFEQEIIERFKMNFPLIEYEDDRGDKIIIDSEYSFDNAIKIAIDQSKDRRLDQIYLDIFLSEKPGYIYNCKRCRHDFLRDSTYGNNDFCDEWEKNNYRRSTTPIVRRNYTQAYNTPAPRSQMTSTNYTRTNTHRTYTPMRSKFY